MDRVNNLVFVSLIDVLEENFAGTGGHLLDIMRHARQLRPAPSGTE
jgi:hypothetical protein